MSIIERGGLIRNCADPKSLAYFSENKQLVTDLYKKFRIEWALGRDGKPLNISDKEWICHGSRGQLWEYGRGILGVTVQGPKWTRSFIQQTNSFCEVTQHGSDEVNLRCKWTSENVDRLATLLKLHKSHKLVGEAKKRVLMSNLKLSKALPEALGEAQKRSEGTCS